MDLTVTEAATLLGLTPRAVRARLVRGELKGRKHGGQWKVRKTDLPQTPAELAETQARVTDLRDALEAGIPAAVKKKLGAIPLDALEAFDLGRAVLTELTSAAAPALDGARQSLEAGLISLAAGHHRFARKPKLEALRRSRDHVSEAIARLLLVVPGDPRAHDLATRLETEALPRLAGLIRWAERLGDAGGKS